MSDFIKHECGIAHIRLLKPIEFYKEKYGTAFYGINKMYLMMQKQHNRCLLYTSPSPRDMRRSRMPSSA